MESNYKFNERIGLDSPSFNYICLGKFVNIMDSKVWSGEIGNLNNKVDLSRDCVYSLFDNKSSSSRVTVTFSIGKFKRYLCDNGYKAITKSALDSEIGDYVNNLIKDSDS